MKDKKGFLMFLMAVLIFLFAAPLITAKQGKNSLDLTKYSGDFDCINKEMLSAIPKDMLAYFKTRDEFKIMDYSSGNIFGNGAADFVFVVFDVSEKNAKILIYNAKKRQFRVLFRTLKVIRTIEQENCNCSYSSAMDELLGERVIDALDYGIKRCESFKDEFCKCADISKDGTFVLERGCYANDYNKNNVKGFDAVCISTHGTYNNWDCLRYNKKIDAFEFFYGQAFAD